MRIRHLAAAIAVAIVAMGTVPSRADVTMVPDPDKWIEQGLRDITAGKTDEFVHNYLALIDQPNSFESVAGNLRVLTRLGAPVFVEKVSEVKFGDVLREVIYVALYRKTDYMYFKFTIKKNTNGYLISNFAFKNEASGLFPPGFYPPQ